jgi:hypothetical protein
MIAGKALSWHVSAIFIVACLGHIACAAAPITVEDFILDAGSYVGRTVDVIGLVACDGIAGQQDCSLLMPGQMDSQLDVDVASLTRDDRKRMLDCAMEEVWFGRAPCQAVVSGEVEDSVMGPVLKASSISWRD